MGPSPSLSCTRDVRAVGKSRGKETLGLSPSPSSRCAGVLRLEEDVRATQRGSQIWNQTLGVRPRQPWVHEQVSPRACSDHMGRLHKLLDLNCQTQGPRPSPAAHQEQRL